MGGVRYPAPTVAQLRLARETLLATGDLAEAADELGMTYATLAKWNRQYGWLATGWPSGRSGRPKRWRCDCGRLVVKARRCACGQVPAWAA